MRCTRVEKFLPLYVAGDLARRRTARRIANHLATCERCRTAAEEFNASRNLVRDAATLPPDFDGAFYAELRRSVLAEIERERPRHAPRAAARFASLFNARFAYAASLASVLVAVAALSLHSYVGQKPEDGARRPDIIAGTNPERTATPAMTTATPVPTQANAEQTLSPHVETARENKRRELQAFKLSSSPRGRTNGNAQYEAQRSVNLAKHKSFHAERNPPAPIVAATTANAEQIARNNNSGAIDVAPEVSRIEIQTSDPNIRIIWLSPKPDDAVAQPLK